MDKEIILKKKLRMDSTHPWLKEYRPYLKDIKNMFETIICDGIIKYRLKKQFPYILKKVTDENKSEIILNYEIIKDKFFNPIWESIEKDFNELLKIQTQVSKLIKQLYTKHPQDIDEISIIKEQLEAYKKDFDKLENKIKKNISLQTTTSSLTVIYN